jgi:Xaa-Pro aminopeptidase
MTFAAGENTNHPHARPSDRPLRRGDVIMTDCGGVFNGYGSDIARVGVVGSPSAAERDAYRVLYDVHRETIAQIVPGITFAALYRYCQDAFSRRGYRLPNPHVGHNLSILGGHEEPLIQPYEQETVRTGMLLCIEPSLQMAPDARMHLEDLVLVTEGGPRILCWWDATELFVFAER